MSKKSKGKKGKDFESDSDQDHSLDVKAKSGKAGRQELETSEKAKNLKKKKNNKKAARFETTKIILSVIRK